MLASGNVPVLYLLLSDGFRGTDQTVDIMRKITTGSYGMRSPRIRALAINILRGAGVPEKAYAQEANAIFCWVRDNIRYTKDVVGQETLCPPEEIAFNTRAGDCDDKAMLCAALLGSIGTQTRFKVMGVNPTQYSHVYLVALVNGTWIPMDPIMAKNVVSGASAKPMGWEAPKAMRKVEKVFADNLPEGTPMARRQMSGLGYIADSRIVSHLEPDPPSQAPAPGYVIMDSMLDTDLPIEQISNNMPAFPQNGAYPDGRMPGAGLRRMGARLLDQRLPPAMVAARVQQEEARMAASEWQANHPMSGLHDVMTPDRLADMGTPMIDEAPRANMQRPALAQVPEGIDVQFGRRALVMRGDKGDRIIYRGLMALNERPPVRPVRGTAGLDGVGPSGALPGMGHVGYLAGRGLSGPGMADLSDANDTAQITPGTGPSPNPIPWGKFAIAGALVLFGMHALRR